MSNSNIEILATYKAECIRFENANGDTIIGDFAAEGEDAMQILETVGVESAAGYFQGKGRVGDDDLEKFERNRTYRLFGRFRDYFNQRYGTTVKQFWFSDFVEHTPCSKEGLIDYLASHGKHKKIGPSRARVLVDKFGVEDVLRVCRVDPDAVAKVTGVPTSSAQSFARSLQEQQDTERTQLELNQILGKRGFPRSIAKQLAKKFKNSAPTVIQNDPYVLMDFHGVGFALADKLWLDLAKDPRDIRRQTMCMWSIIHSDRSGSVWFPLDRVVTKFRTMIGGETDWKAAVLEGKRIAEEDNTPHGAIATMRTDGSDGPISPNGSEVWLAEAGLASDERSVAVSIAESKDESSVDLMTEHSQNERIEFAYLKHATCTRCHRHLTADTVSVLNGQPYGPICIKTVPGGETAESFPLEDWIAENPTVERWIEENRSGVIRVSQASLWPDPATIEGVSEHQREALDVATSERVGILTGSPGTGKTTSIAALVKAILNTGFVAMSQIAMAAPTGKAAVRMSQSLNDKGLRLQARTWHSLLGTSKEPGSGSDGWKFEYGKRNPWPFKIIIGDEHSMPDVRIKRCILDARAFGTHFLFSGDVNQLAPVGPGAPLRDMIAAGIPTGELTEIHRNADGIVQACTAIKNGQRWASQYVDDWDSNLTVTNDQTDQQKIDRILSLLGECAEEGIDPIWDTQVLIAVNEKSELSRTKINKMIQDVVNDHPIIEKTRFRLADKVICLKNNEYPHPDLRTPVYVANGEIGQIIDIDQKSRSMTIELRYPDRKVRIFFGTDRTKDGKVTPGTSNWDLGYAISCHKFQGSECSRVITVLDSYRGAKMVCDRSWMTTAISRAVDHQYLVGTASQAEQFCQRLRITERKTFLRERIIVANLNRECDSL